MSHYSDPTSQDTRPHADLEDTLPHRLVLEDTWVHPPAPQGVPPDPSNLEDTRPSQPVARPRSRRRRRRWLRDAWNMALITGILAAGIVTLLVVLYRAVPPPRTTILVMGVDARQGEGWVARSDSMMLVTIDPSNLYVGVLSIPRDLYIDIPGYGSNRINVAHILGEQEQTGGGPALAARTVEQVFGVPVHRTVRLKFDGFVKIIDAAGGVDIDVPKRIVDNSYPTSNYGVMSVTFELGRQHMDGQRALIYARTRHADSDFYRAQRQQAVMTALISKLAAPQNWAYWPAVAAAVSQNVEADLTLWDAAVLAPTVLWVGANGIDKQAITNDMATGFQTSGGASVLAPHWDRINPVLDRMFRR